MGVIRVKLSNNYFTQPQEAADKYLSNNRINKIITPSNIIPGTFEIVENCDLRKGFAVTAKKTDGGYWGFAVCFLKNQQTGYTALYEKHLDKQASSGLITDNYLNWWLAGYSGKLSTFLNNPASGLLTEYGTFVHPAWLSINALNEVSNQDQIDLDFNYPSPIFPDQPNFYLNDTNTNITSVDKRTMQTSQRGEQNIPGTNQEENEGFGAYGDNPWPKCSMVSFYSVNASKSGDKGDLESDLIDGLSECAEQQENEWQEQWEQIDSGGGPA